MNIDAIDLTRKLVNIESISYHEGAVGAFLAEYLAARRYAVERMAVASTIRADEWRRCGGAINVTPRSRVLRPMSCLSTHMDTVPPFFGCTEDDEFL